MKQRCDFMWKVTDTDTEQHVCMLDAHESRFHECGCGAHISRTDYPNPENRTSERRTVEYGFDWVIVASFFEEVRNAAPDEPSIIDPLLGIPRLSCTCVYFRGKEIPLIESNVRCVRYSRKECPVHGEGTDR